MRALLLALVIASPAAAAERNYSVTDFDRVRLDAPLRVNLLTGRAPAARAMGSAAALDALKVEVQGRTLVIGRNVSAWGAGGGDAGPVTLSLATPALRGAAVNGGGLLAIDAIRGGTVQLTVGGAGAMDVASLDADALAAAMVGDGRMTLAGAARTATLQLRGNGSMAAEGLLTDHLRVGADGTGTVTAAARTTANVQASGTGSVTVTGDAACTVKALGSALVRCGSDKTR